VAEPGQPLGPRQRRDRTVERHRDDLSTGGMPEFMASYHEAVENHRMPNTKLFRSLVTLDRASADDKGLAASTIHNHLGSTGPPIATPAAEFCRQWNERDARNL
jgi:hypothetical protein